MSRPLTYLDVFTDTPLAGNQLAVVLDADDVETEHMQAFARETRLSETTFVQGSSGDDADYVNRIFCMTHEMDFAGHPSLGTAVAVARHRGLDRASWLQRTRSGLQPVEAERVDGERWRASVLTGTVTLGEEVDRAAVASAAGIAVADLHPALPPQVGTTGNPVVLVPVADASVLDRIAPTYDGVGALLDASASGGGVLYLVALSGDGTRADARSFFRNPGELGEDPATGSAAAPLCAYARARLGSEAIEVTQGVAMGRPSVLRCTAVEDRVRVAGDVVVVSDGVLLV